MIVSRLKFETEQIITLRIQWRGVSAWTALAEDHTDQALRGIGFQCVVEPIDCVAELERVQQRHRTIELLLCRAVARGHKAHRPELFDRHGMLMLLRNAAACCQNQNAGAKGSRAQHGRPSEFPLGRLYRRDHAFTWSNLFGFTAALS